MIPQTHLTTLQQRLAEAEAENLRLRRERAAVVHDARGQLANLAGFLQLLVLREGTRLGPDAQAYAGRVLGAIGELRAILDRFATGPGDIEVFLN